MTAPSATVVATLLDIARHALGERAGKPSWRARAHVVEAILVVCRETGPEAALALVGADDVDSAALAVAAAMGSPDWSRSVTAEIVGALRIAVALPEKLRRGRVIEWRAANTTAVLMGDPAAGRSALDERRVA